MNGDAHDMTDVTDATVPAAVAPWPTPRSVGVVGLGLIGGSLARRLNDAGCRVLTWNHTTRPYQAAAAQGIACLPTLEALAQARPEVLVLCNPLKAMPEMLQRLKPVLDDATTLTDVGSVKGMVREQVRAAGLGERYVGAHPMAGNERSGWSAADPALYDDALWAVSVDEDTAYERFQAVAGMIVGTSRNRMIVIDDATHDRAAALISHMPHVVATALVDELVDSPERDVAVALAAGSWRDMTRVALTDPDRTRAMVEEDAANVEALLRRMAARLSGMADALHAWRSDGPDENERTRAQGEILRFFAAGQPFRDYKAEAAAGEAHGATATLGLGDDWREALMASARRGEHVVGLADARHVAVQRRSHLAD